MRCSPIYMNLLVTSVLASPALVAVPDSAHNEAMSARNIAETDLIAETIIFGVESAKCKILKCAKIIATGACIIGALPDIDSTLACVSDDKVGCDSPAKYTMLQNPASPADSTSLSTPRSDVGELVTHLEEESLKADANTPGFIHPAPADEDGQAQNMKTDTDCPHCGRTYASERNRDRHVKDKKTACYKNREAVDVTGNSWSCSRCKMRVSKTDSVEHHIKETCWKNCDQCCKHELTNGLSKCDGFSKEGNCSNCEKAGLACSKQTKQVSDCVPQHLTGEPTKSGDAPGQTAEISLAKRKKRKPDQSPEKSPQSKPKAKRKTKIGPENSCAAPKFGVVDKVDYDDEDHAVLDEPYPAARNLFPGIGHTGRSHLASPPIDHMDPQPHQPRYRYNAISHSSAMPARQHPRMLPPLSDYASYGGPTGPLGGPNMQEMVHRQLQTVHGIVMTPHHAPGHGAGTSQEQVLHSSLGETHHQPNGFDHFPIHNVDYAGPRPHLADAVQVYQDQPIPVHDAILRKFTDGQLSVPGSAVSSRRASFAENRPSAPGSQADSRQSSVERMRDALVGDGSDHNSNQVNGAGRGRQVVQLPLPQVLKYEVAYSSKASPATGIPTSLIRLRIHSNTFDNTGLAIFSILAMGPGEIFGPRLEYYCAQRGKRYGIDWKFLFKYDAPIAGNAGRKKYFDLLWNMTPRGCLDHEYPHAAMRDGDTLLVVNRRPITAQVEHDDLGTALEPQRILFKNGEDPNTKSDIHQNLAVNADWYKEAERSLFAAKKDITAMRDQIGHLRYLHREDVNIIGELQQVNAQLKHHLAVVRGGQVPSQPPRVHVQQHMSTQELAYRENVRLNQGAAQIRPRPQLNEHFALLPRAHHGQPPSQRRRVNGAAGRVEAEGERKL
ncbi:hypothetical protein BDU57DRAFT_546802 [Ampelomyces quisqualis]|uniref:C2H2-type domain-containing protein n=1 Tax=Ampelomyces quisqualis TaxID=50730 RepID=A0A6A5QPA3_AMPQU|nr:hypothetical protein BDU57DRAFT_546802 [Ampelomyces quisqualis]